MKHTLAITLALSAHLACSISSSQNRGVKVPGESSEERAALAQRLIESVRAADPANALRAAVPGASGDLLSNLRLKPMHLAGVTTGDGAFDEMFVQCSVAASPSDTVATQLVEACKTLVEQHLARLQSRESAAQPGAAADRQGPGSNGPR